MSDTANSPRPYYPEQRLKIVQPGGIPLAERISEDEQRKLKEWQRTFSKPTED